MANMEQKASVKVSVNGEEAKKELDNLQKIAKGLRTQLAEASEAKDWKGSKKLDADLKKVERQMARVKRETYDFNEVLTRLDHATPKELRQTLSAINREMNSGRVERGSTAWKDYQQKAAQVKKELQAINQEQKVAEPLITRLGNSVKNFFSSGVGKLVALTGVGFGTAEAISAYTSINESMIDLKKYTDLTDASAESLQKRFKGLVTSVEIEKLNAYAAEAGKLNEQGEEAIYNYAEAAKIIDQGLGADLGEGATEQIAKLAKMYGEDDSMGLRGAMLATASAINDVAQSGTSNERYLVDFTARIGGVANNLNIAQADIIGFGAVLDENMQGVERSSTALQDVMIRMTSAPSKYAEIAGISVREFTEMLKTDANEALLSFLGGIKGIGDLTDASPVLKELKLTGSGMASTLTTLSSNLDAVRERQLLANQAYSEGTSVVIEAELAETSAIARKKQMENQLRNIAAEYGERLLPLQLSGLSATTKLLQVGLALIKVIEDNKRMLGSIIAVLTAYWVGVKMAAMWTAVQTKANLILAGTYNLLSGNITQAKVAWHGLTAAMKANPFGLILAAITAFGAGLYALSQRMSFVQKMTSTMFSTIKMERNELDQLVTQFKKTEKGSKEYLAIKDQLQLKYGETLTAINLEVEALYDNIDAQNKMADAVERTAKAKMKAEYNNDAYEKQIKTESKWYTNIRENIIKELGQEKGSAAFDEIRKELDSAISGDKLMSNEDLDDLGKLFTDRGLKDTQWWRHIIGYINKSKVDLEQKKAEIEAVFGKDIVQSTPDNRLAELNSWFEKEKQALDLSYSSGEVDSKKHKENLLRLDLDYLEKKKNLFVKGSKEYEDIENEIAQKKGFSTYTPQGDPDKKLKADLKKLDAWYAQQKATEASHYLQGLQSKIQYDDKMLEHERSYQERKRDLYAVGSKEYEELQAQILQKEIDAKVKADAESRTKLSEAFEQQKAMLKQSYIDGNITRESFQQQSISNEIAYLRKMALLHPANSSERLKLEQQAEELANKDKLAKREEFEQKRKQLQQKYSKASMADMYNLELSALESLHAQKLLSEEEYQKARQALERDYTKATTTSFLDSEEGQVMMDKAQFYLSSFQTLASGFNDFIRAETDGQIAAINQKYDTETKAAGNNQYKLKQIEEKKQKEIAAVQAKAADKALALQMSMALAQAFLGSLSAYSSTAAIPIIGPTLAPIAAGVALAAGMLNVASIAKQHQTAKKGYYDGGFTGGGAWDEEQGVVHSNEFVANRFAVRNPHVRGILDVIDVAQRNNTIASLTTADIVSESGYRSSVSVPGGQVGDDNSEATLALFYKLNDTVDKLNKRLDSPIQAYTTIDGEYGVKKGLDDFDATEKNKSR